ncbi:glycosyltransferase family 2 protein [Patescibacteria group bacterium]|nr:glycosyltransferase family 2 protein [Patescibacteria group bacterium]MBU1931402.1 glycosyltransferase family 2 protein [Patescibacteria group bacterium]
MKQPQISVIILNWNRKQDTVNLIRQLKKQTFKNFEIIVVDNASTDGSAAYVKCHYSDVRLVRAKNNQALYSFSLGMKQARGEYFVLLACDTVVPANLLAKHLEKLTNNPQLGVSCPSTYDHSTKRYLGPNRAIKGNNKIGYQITYFDGNGIGLRRQVFEQVGGYSQDYFICLEELEWAVRILSAGFKVACFTDVKIYHKKSTTAGEYRSRLGYYYVRNWIWFYLQYLPWRAILEFVKLHFGSFRAKTGAKGYFNKLDCLWGIIASFPRISKYLWLRQPVSDSILARIKADLFPNKGHIYVQ